MKRVTMADIARRASVSKSTVSHVINGTRFVAEDTRRRVLQAIEELDYRPSQVARSLASRRTYTAGLLISDVGNPFYHQVILGVEDVALQHNYSVFLFNASYDLERSRRYILSMIDRRVDGVLFMSSRLSRELIGELGKHQVPAVVLDWEVADLERVAYIVLDFEAGIREAVEHLTGLGHERFAHVSGPLDLWTARTRRDLFLRALGERGIDASSVPVVEGNLRVESGRQALGELLRLPAPPTAIFTANDLMALGVLWEARQQGLHVPRDVSVVGLDDIELASQISPELTTVRLPRYEIGCRAMEMLLDLIQAGDELAPGPAPRQVMQTHLVIRQSTAAPRERRTGV